VKDDSLYELAIMFVGELSSHHHPLKNNTIIYTLLRNRVIRLRQSKNHKTVVAISTKQLYENLALH